MGLVKQIKHKTSQSSSDPDLIPGICDKGVLNEDGNGKPNIYFSFMYYICWLWPVSLYIFLFKISMVYM